MKFYKVILTVLCLSLLLGLCACVDARAGEQETEAATDSATVEITPTQRIEDPLPHKTPIDQVSGKDPEKSSPEKSPLEKSTQVTDGLIIDIGEDYDPGLIPVPKPVEPPVEEQSAESSAAEE